MDKKLIQKETLNNFKLYLLKQAGCQSMSEDFTLGFDYALYEMERYAKVLNIEGIVEGRVNYDPKHDLTKIDLLGGKKK